MLVSAIQQCGSVAIIFLLLNFSLDFFSTDLKSKPFLGPGSYKNGRWVKLTHPGQNCLAGAGRITPRVWCG